MTPRIWTRLGAGLAAGALIALGAAPAALAARELPDTAALLSPGAAVEQLGFSPYPQCAVSGGGSTGIFNNGGQTQVFSFGAGGFHSPYYSPSYGSFGVGTIGGFLNFTGGVPFCASPFSNVQYSTAPFVINSLGPTAGTLGLQPLPGVGGWGSFGGWGGFPPNGANIGIFIR